MRARWVTAALLLVVLTVLCVLLDGCGGSRPTKKVAPPPQVNPAAKARPTEKVAPPPEISPKAVIWRTPGPTKEAQAGDVWVNPKDGMEMVYVAAGEFVLGTSDDAPISFGCEQPQCRVNLPGYWMGRTEVTNAQYLRFVRATGHRAPDHWEGGQIPSGLDDFPVVFAGWEDARAYAEWTGGRLPSELEWEKSARGADGRVFPWGDQWDSTRCRSFEAITGRKGTTLEERWHWGKLHDPVREGPAAVGSYGAGVSPYGCLDMVGNVQEWCADWYDENAYQRYAKGDLRPPTSGTLKVLRGGSWFEDGLSTFSCAARSSSPDFGCDRIGFRYARGLP